MSSPEQPAIFAYEFSKFNPRTFAEALRVLTAEELASFEEDYSQELSILNAELQQKIENAVCLAIVEAQNFSDVDEAFPTPEPKPEPEPESEL